jgi:DNA recombination protein RmuC
MEIAVFIIAGIIVGFGTAYIVWQKSLANMRSLIEVEKAKNDELNKKILELTAQNATLSSKAQHAVEYTQKMKDEFRLLAAEAMAKQEEQNKNAVELTLKPLKEQLESFRKKVDDTYNAESAERKHLSIAVKELKEQNQKLGAEALALTNALKSRSKTQGMWGEMVLESILNASGLRKGIEYTLQGGHVDEEGGRIIPDAIVNMPDNKKIIIDSKVTLLSYMEYCEADTDEARSVAAKALLTSIKKHIDTLSTKRYQDIDGAFEYVFMFVPLEGAYMTAIAEDKGLFEYALSKNVALTTASSLMTTLKTVYMIWRSERQNQNAALIAKEAGAVYDKMAGFLAEFEKINTNLKRASDSYENARKLLATGRGAALARLEKLKEMGAKTGKSIEEYIEYTDVEMIDPKE